jgi:hypothetical protein
LDPPKPRYWQDRGDQSDGYATRENERKNGNPRRDWGVKICPADPDGNSNSDHEAQR